MSTIYTTPKTQLSTSPENNITQEDIARIDHTEQKHGNKIHALELRVAAQQKEIVRLRRDISKLKNQLEHIAGRVRG